MNRLRNVLLLMTFLVFATVELLGQITASHSMGCSGLQVTYSVSNAGSSPNWSFTGNGSMTSIDGASTQVTWQSSGVVTVSYLPIGGSTSQTFTASFTMITGSSVTISPSADPLTLAAGTTVNLTASGGGANYRWIYGILTGTPVNPSGTNTVPASVGGTYYAVGDNKCSKSILVNYVPLANARADQYLATGVTSCTLDGIGWDQDGEALNYLWSKISGPAAAIVNTSLAKTTVNGLVNGTYTFRLRVTDNQGKYSEDDVLVTVGSVPNDIYNFTREENILVKDITTVTQIGSLPAKSKKTSTVYYDDSGKPMETVVSKGSPLGNDIMQPLVYDVVGRTATTYLPVVYPQSSGNYQKLLDASGEYTGSVASFYQDKAYAKSIFETSPLSRTIEQGSEGQAWQPGSVSGTTKLSYGTNVTNEVIRWTINASNLPVSTEMEPAGLLTAGTSTTQVSTPTQTVTQTFTNSLGLKVLERIKVDANNWAETYYVYDTRNNLRIIIPPALSKILRDAVNYAPAQTLVDRWCYQSIYDHRDRVIGTKGPGQDWEYTVYDKRDRVVLTQNGLQRQNNSWDFVKYDDFDRPVITGIYKPATVYTRDNLQQTVDNLNNGKGYQNTTSPTHAGVSIRTGTDIVSGAYDNFKEYVATNSVRLTPGFMFSANGQNTFRAATGSSAASDNTYPSQDVETLTVTYYDNYSGNNEVFQDPAFAFYAETFASTGGESFVKFNRVQGQITGVSEKVLNTGQWLHTVIYYDYRQRPIQTYSSMHLGGVSRTSRLYHFSNNVLESKSLVAGVLTTRTFSYDNAWRIVKLEHQINTQPKVILASYQYNELGEVIDKKLHSADNGSTYLQSIDYGYNIKGWLTKANSAVASDPGETDYFGYELGYETDAFAAVATNNLRKDGIATAVKWRRDLTNKQRLYTFDYNSFNYLSAANYKSGIASPWNSQTDFFTENSITYDYNGNIKTLKRNQKKIGFDLKEKIDDLTYNYGPSEGNQLMKVTEGSTDGLKDLGFKDGNTTGDDYAYDVNGNLTGDKNKGISLITYNSINLPDKVLFNDNTYMKYAYTAGGEKLTQTYFDASNQSIIKTDYIVDQVLVNDIPSIIFHEEGRLLPPDNTNLILNREANSTEGYTGNLSVTLSSVYQNSQTYVKVVSNQATGNPGVFIGISSAYSVKPGERYQFKVLGYRETAQNAKLYVKHASGDIIWSTGTLLPQGLSNETWSTSEFVVPPNVTQITVGVRWENPTNGATMYINQVALYKMDWEYQYFLKDQVGSPRVILSTNPSTQKYTATFESENQSTESGTTNLPGKFFNIDPAKLTPHPSNVTPGGNEMIAMNNTYRIGPSRSLKVYPGDRIDASVSAYYATASGLTPTTTAMMVTKLVEVMTTGGLTGIDVAVQNAYSLSEPGTSNLFTLSPDNGTSKPSAFLNYILFDENYLPLEAKSVSVGNANAVHTLSFGPVSIKEVGIMFVYLSYDNASSHTVYFDELKLTHTESPVVQVNDYYPFGLTSYSWIREGEYENRFLYQGKEIDVKTGWQDFHARQYDAALGRWFVMDPAGQFSSPYNGMGNNPIMGVDPDGRFWNFIIGAAIGGISNYISGRAAGLRGWDLAGQTIAGAAIGAITSGVGSAVSSSVVAAGGSTFAGAVAGGVAGGAVGGGFGSAINGGSFLDGAWRGALLGGVTAGLGGIGTPENFGGNLALGIGEGAAAGALGAALFGGDIGQGALYGGILGGAFATATSPQLKNAFRGQGFRSNTKVLASFVATENYQGALDYFGFEGTYDPSKTGGNPAVTNTHTGAISYSDNAFAIYDDQGGFRVSYDRLAAVVDHEYFHRMNVLSGKYAIERPIPMNLVGLEEHGAYMRNYQRQGLYRGHGFNLANDIQITGAQGLLYDQYSYFQRKWWHFLYRIPRRY